MNSSVSLVVLCMLVMFGGVHAAQPPVSPRVIAIVGARVIPMTGEQVLDDATVLVADGVIRAVGTADTVKIPKGARVIGAQGKFLLPGLSEMHAHVPSGPTPEIGRAHV